MRKISMLILCVLIISLATPVFAITSTIASDGTTMILTLDDNDMPSICECSCKIVPMEVAGSYSILQPLFSPLLIPSHEELPPKV